MKELKPIYWDLQKAIEMINPNIPPKDYKEELSRVYRDHDQMMSDIRNWNESHPDDKV